MWNHVTPALMLTQIYNDRRLFFGGGPGVIPNDSYGSIASSGQSADRRSTRGRGMLMPVSFPFSFFLPEFQELILFILLLFHYT